MPFNIPELTGKLTAYGVSIPGPMEIATGLLSQTSGLGYIVAAFFLFVVGILVIFKLFDTLTKVVVVAGISAFTPVAINVFTGVIFGTGIFQLTPQLIVGFMTLGISVFFIYGMVTTGLGLIERIISIITMPLRSVIRHGRARSEKREKKEFQRGLKEIKKIKEEKSEKPKE
jgi:hypothetical protein